MGNVKRKIRLYKISFATLVSHKLVCQCVLALLILTLHLLCLEILVHDYADVAISAICSEKQSLATVFDMLSTGTETDYNIDTKPEMLRQFSALALSSAGEQGILGNAT